MAENKVPKNELAENPPEIIHINVIGKRLSNYWDKKPDGLYAKTIEYILESAHLKIKNDWFARGLKAGKISKNKSGCCCVFEEDGETISQYCGAHKEKIQEASKKAIKPIMEVYEMYRDTKTIGMYFGCEDDLWQAIEKTIKEDGERVD